MELKILTPEKILFEGQVESINLPTPGGIITVLPKHTSLVTPLSAGQVSIKNKEGSKSFLSGGGVFEVSQNKAVLLLRNHKSDI
jgi:F-type H+-transporting ATPase subunit epsilon